MNDFESYYEAFMLDTPYADTAHDLSHIKRVVVTAKKLAIDEGANLDVVVAAAWLHDCVSVAKNHPDRPRASMMAADKAIDFLTCINFPEALLGEVHHAIEAHSFSAGVEPKTLEAKIVQDADRMDALGAIGISRCMKVGGAISRQLYDENDPFGEHRELDDESFTLDHFFIKLLKIADSMHTKSAQQEAKERTSYMRDFLSQLGKEIGHVAKS